jgi:hypothetical protein
MHRVVCAALTDWLAGKTAPDKGVNALLPGVPRDPMDAAALPVEHFGDPFRDEHAARYDGAPKPRTIYVHPDGPITLEGEVGATDRKAHSVAVAVRVVVKSAELTASARWASYVERAIAKSLAAFLAEDPDGTAARSRDGYRIVTANALRAGPWKESVGEAEAIAVVAADFQVRDQAPR